MLYVGYLIILDVRNIKKKLVSEISILELPRLENYIIELCPEPLGSNPPPPPPNTQVWCQTHEKGQYMLYTG